MEKSESQEAGQPETTKQDQATAHAAGETAKEADILKDHYRIQQDYEMTLQEAQAFLLKRYSELTAESAQALEKIFEEMQRELLEAYRTYVESVNEISSKNEYYEPALETFQEYSKASKEMYEQTDMKKQSEEAYLQLLGKLRKAQEEPDAHGLIQDAYRDYASDLNKAWSENRWEKEAESAGTAYTKLLAEADTAGRQRLLEAYKTYIAAVQEIITRSQFQQKYETNYKEYVKNLGDVSSEVQRRCTDAYLLSMSAYQKLQ